MWGYLNNKEMFSSVRPSVHQAIRPLIQQKMKRKTPTDYLIVGSAGVRNVFYPSAMPSPVFDSFLFLLITSHGTLMMIEL